MRVGVFGLCSLPYLEGPVHLSTSLIDAQIAYSHWAMWVLTVVN